MATYVPPKINVQLIFYSGLVDQSNTKLLKSNPTIAAGDFKTSLDGAALGNLGTLPAVTPASSVMVKFTLATTEMNGANATVVCIDAAGAEWCDQLLNWQTSARQIDDLAYPATSGRSMVVDANGLVDANMVKAGPTASGTAQTAGDIFARLGAPAGASMSADIAAVKVDTAAVKVQTDKLTFTVANQVDSNVLDWKSSTAPAMTGDAYARLGAPAGASVSADIAAAKVDTAAIKVQTDKLTFTVANQIDANVLDWKSATAPAMTGDAYARLGAPSGASVSADILAIFSRLGAPAGASMSADIAAVKVDSAAIKAKTDSLTFTNAGKVDSTVLVIATNAIDAASTSADFLAEISAAVESLLSTSTRAELSAVPAANASLVAKITWLAELARNKITNDGTSQILKADDGTTTVATAPVSKAAGVTTRGEWA